MNYRIHLYTAEVSGLPNELRKEIDEWDFGKAGMIHGFINEQVEKYGETSEKTTPRQLG